ncbi:MAG: response regulator [Methanobacteriaceae archaeon]|nr:response regulator [Methanobacteriaceae archaeon]
MKYTPQRVLLVEDDPQHAESINAMLERVHEFDFVLKHCYKLQEGLKILKAQEFDVILLDLGLPDSSGFETFLSMHQQSPSIPIVIFTSLFDEEIALKTLNSGAQEYLFKGEYDGQDLVTAINHSIARMKFIEDSN